MLTRLVAALLVVLIGLARPAAADPAAEARRLVALADTASWFAMNDGGDLPTFDAGLGYLVEAEALLPSVDDEATRGALAAEIAALQESLTWQRESYHDKLAAVFPLIRYYGTTLLLDANALGSHELVDDPRDRAAEQALKGLLQLRHLGWQQRPQIDALFAADPLEPELEEIALSLFNASPRYFVHNGRELMAALQTLDPTGALAAEVTQGRVTPAAARALTKAFGVDRLLLVTLHRQASAPDDWFYIAEAQVLREAAALDEGLVRSQVMGFGRDRTQLIWPLVAANLLLWGLAIGWHQWLRGGRLDAGDFVVPSLGFAVGRIAPWLILPALGQFRPDGAAFAPLAFWWPAMAGLAVIALPLALLRGVGRRLPLIAPYLAWERGAESLGLALASGVAAWWATPLLAYRGLDGVWALLLLLPGLFATTALLARIGRAEASALVWAAPLLALALGLAVATTTESWIAAASAVALALAVPALLRRPVVVAETAQEQPRGPQAVYRPFQVLEHLQRATAPLDAGQVAWVALTGPAGSGKSAHARALIAELGKAQHDGSLLLLDGACQRLNGGGPVPFGPFQHCLAQHLKLDVRQAAGAEDSVTSGLYDLLLGPLAPLFSGERGLGASERDLYAFVARALRQQAARARVVLLVEDAQWLDEASLGLLRYLRRALPPGAPASLLVLLVGRRDDPEKPGFGELLPGAEEIALAALSLDESRELLTLGYGLSPRVADWCIDWLGAGRGQSVTAGTFGEVVEQLVIKRALAPGEQGLDFVPGFDKAHPPLSASAVEEAGRALATLPEARETLAVAACLGRSFEASLVAAALAEPRGQVLKRLEALERQTSLVRDVLEVDDLFEFRSQRALDAVREVLSLRLRGPRAGEVPQAVRETHAAVARALEGRAKESLTDLLRMATHWYGAGRSYAGQAIAANLLAAQRLAQLLRFDEAETFLGQAADYAGLVDHTREVEDERLRLAAERAHVTGQGARSVAEAGLARLRDSPAQPALQLAIARACYEAGRDDGASLAAEAERLSLAVAEGEAAPLDRAQGWHLAGLALRFVEARREEARNRLRQALALAEGEGTAGEGLAGQIANSLALLESGFGEEGRAEAERLFSRSIELKQAQAIPDRPGLARSYGGLGLLLLESGERARLQEAEDWLKKDLDLARDIGDLGGQSKARLWLGRCHLEQGETQEAEACFAAVVQQNQSPADLASAEAGLLAVAAAQGDRAGFLALAGELAGRFADRPAPAESRPALAAALAWPEVAGEPAVVALKAALGELAA